MKMETMAKLLASLRKDVRAMWSRASQGDAPRAVPPNVAARLLGITTEQLKRDIRLGRIQTVSVGRRQMVPLSQIRSLAAPNPSKTARKKPSKKKTRS